MIRTKTHPWVCPECGRVHFIPKPAKTFGQRCCLNNVIEQGQKRPAPPFERIFHPYPIDPNSYMGWFNKKPKGIGDG